MNRWAGKLAIVTGASSGIGAAISKTLVYQGVNVLGLARREDRLINMQMELADAKGVFHYVICDVLNEEDIVRVFKYAEEKLAGVDILINNAGLVKFVTFTDITKEDIEITMGTNFIAAVLCIREALKSLRKNNKEGHIVNINSIAGYSANLITAPINVYPASKFAMRAMIDTLRVEITQAKDKIRLTSIYPGIVKTELIGIIDDTKQKAADNIMPALESEDIANCIMYALAAPPHVQIEDLTITGCGNKKCI